jgi:ketosteroid isomerase-like protein
MRYKPIPFLIVLFAVVTLAQTGPCTENAIKQGDLPTADNAFAFMPPYGKPVIGKPAIKDANTKSFSDRSNIQHSWVGDHRIVPSPSGDMAYEYGTMKVSYDSKADGHQTFEAVILSVYKASDGVCRKVALTMQPLEQEEQKH